MSEAFTHAVGEYRTENGSLVERVTREFESRGGEMEDLDELVIDVASGFAAGEANETADEDEQDAAISAGEAAASTVNNCEADDQVAAILMGHGEEEGERLVMDAIENKSSPKP
jgi:hypothetical protein